MGRHARYLTTENDVKRPKHFAPTEKKHEAAIDRLGLTGTVCVDCNARVSGQQCRKCGSTAVRQKSTME